MKRIFRALGYVRFNLLPLLAAAAFGAVETIALARSRCNDAWRQLEVF